MISQIAISGGLKMRHDEAGSHLREDLGRLTIVEHAEGNLDEVEGALREDRVVLFQKVSATQADALMYKLADRFGLADALKLQAGYAGFRGHRYNIGKYFMS